MNRRDGLVIARLEPGNDGSSLPPGIPYVTEGGGGIGGATQAHPHPVLGGQAHSLGKLVESPTDGWNALTGGVAQTATGIGATLNAGNPRVIVDMPFVGNHRIAMVMAGFIAACVTPADGCRIGFSLDAVTGSYEFGNYITSLGGVWTSLLDLNGTPLPGSETTTLSATDYVSMHQTMRTNLADSRLRSCNSGLRGNDNPNTAYSASWAKVSELWNFRLDALWVAGSADLVIEWGTFAILADYLYLSTVD